MQAFTIPVAFLVEGENEQDAAQRLSDILAAASLTQDHNADNGRSDDDLGPIQSWWTPNHPLDWEAADIEQVLVFAPGTTYTPVTQAMADEAVSYWNGVIAAIGKDAIDYPVCGASFMAGASCSLPKDHDGGHA